MPLNQKGRSVIEVMFTMLLVMLFAFATLTLVASGSKAYASAVEKRAYLSDLRIGQAYLTTKLRQNNVEGAIEIVYDKTLGSTLILIDDVDYQSGYQTKIFVSEGKLYESLSAEGETPSPDLGFEVCRMDGLELTLSPENVLTIKTWINVEGQTFERVSTMALYQP